MHSPIARGQAWVGWNEFVRHSFFDFVDMGFRCIGNLIQRIFRISIDKCGDDGRGATGGVTTA